MRVPIDSVAVAAGFPKERVVSIVELTHLLVFIAPLGGLTNNNYSAPIYDPPANFPASAIMTQPSDKKKKTFRGVAGSVRASSRTSNMLESIAKQALSRVATSKDVEAGGRERRKSNRQSKTASTRDS